MENNLVRSPLIKIGEYTKENKLNPENLKLLAQYTKDMKVRKLNERSIYSYTCDIKAWFKYIYQEQKNRFIIDLDEGDIEEMINSCKEQGNNAKRLRRRIASISSFYGFLIRRKLTYKNPCDLIERPEEEPSVVIQTALTKEQYNKIKEKLLKAKDTQLLTYAMVSVSTMAKVATIKNIRWEQIEFRNRIINNVLERDGKVVNLCFSKEVERMLLRLKRERKTSGIKSEYVFITKYHGKYKPVGTTTLYEWTKKIGQMIGIRTLHPHDWRYSGSQMLLSEGCPRDVVETLLNYPKLTEFKATKFREKFLEMKEIRDEYEI